jgi:hypothetical protein
MAGAGMLRVALSGADLECVRVASQPAPMLELRTLLREPLLARETAGPAADRAKVQLVRSLVAEPCAPAFVLPAGSDTDDAIETVASARRDAIRRDLDDNVTAGFPLPGWTTDLVRPGQAGTRSRHGLRTALDHVVAAYVEPRTRWAAPVVAARVRAGHPGPGPAHRPGPGLGQRAHADPPLGRTDRGPAGRRPGRAPGDAARLGPAAPLGLRGG